MTKKSADLAELIGTLETAATKPGAVKVGDFATAVQTLQAELRMLEGEVNRLSNVVAKGFDPGVDPATGAPLGIALPAVVRAPRD